MKVGMRLGLGFALVLSFLVAVTVTGILRMAQIQDRLDRVVGVNNVVTRYVIDMRGNVSDRINSLRILTMMSSPDEMEADMNRIKAQTAKYDEIEKKLSDKFAIEASPAEKALLAQVKEQRSAWRCRPSPRRQNCGWPARLKMRPA